MPQSKDFKKQIVVRKECCSCHGMFVFFMFIAGNQRVCLDCARKKIKGGE